MNAIKFVKGSDSLIEGLAIPFGSPKRLDLDGEFFDKSTDLALDWFTERPFLYDHGTDPKTKTSVVGRVVEHEVRDEGVWAKTQLDRSHRYHAAIADLVGKGALGYSSGAMAHLVQKDQKTGHLERWPWVELSGTPTPASPDAWPITYSVKSTEAIAHLAAMAYDGREAGLEHDPYAEHGQRVLADVTAFVKRAEDRRESRTKADRMLSENDRTVLLTLQGLLWTVSADVDSLIRASDPKSSTRATEALGLMADFEAIQARLNGVTI